MPVHSSTRLRNSYLHPFSHFFYPSTGFPLTYVLDPYSSQISPPSISIFPMSYDMDRVSHVGDKMNRRCRSVRMEAEASHFAKPILYTHHICRKHILFSFSRWPLLHKSIWVLGRTYFPLSRARIINYHEQLILHDTLFDVCGSDKNEYRFL